MFPAMAKGRPSASLFQGASNTTINGCAINLNQRSEGTRGWGLFLGNCCFEAQLDSNERFDPPKCDPATRVAITQDIMDWITSDDKRALLLVMHGSAGAGKSALEQSIAKRCQEEGRLASSFFLSRTAPTARRSDGDAVIPTTVSQLSKVFPWFKEALVKEIEEDEGIFTLSRAALMDQLFIRHFGKDNEHLWGDGTQPRLIAIDGLDECNNKAVQCDLLRIIAAAIPRLRYPFRFFIACRPESHLMAIVNNDPHFRTGHVSHRDLGDAQDVDADIRTFLTNQFQIIRATHPVGRHLPASWPCVRDVSKILAKASGHFIYADTVIRFLSARNGRPDDRLEIVLALSPPRCNERPFAQLDALYSYIFSCVEALDLVWRILGVVWLVRQRETRDVPSTPASLEGVLVLRRGDVDLALDQLVSIVRVTSRAAPIKVLHASLFDFLLDRSRAGIYTLDPSLAHESLARWLARQINFDSPELARYPILDCLHHCRSARLSQPVLDTIEKVTAFIISLFNKRHPQWSTHLVDPILYDALLRSISVLFAREDFPHGSLSLNLIRSIGERLHGLKLEVAHYRVAHVLERKIEASQRSESSAWALNVFQRFSPRGEDRATNVKHSVTRQTARLQYLGLETLQPVLELVKCPAGLAYDVQATLAAVRLVFWTQNMDCDISTLSFPAASKRWMLKALAALERISAPVASDAAVLLFVASLLPHCTHLEGHENIWDRLSRLDSLGTKFPKTMEYYRQEVAAYQKRRKGLHT